MNDEGELDGGRLLRLKMDPGHGLKTAWRPASTLHDPRVMFSKSPAPPLIYTTSTMSLPPMYWKFRPAQKRPIRHKIIAQAFGWPGNSDRWGTRMFRMFSGVLFARISRGLDVVLIDGSKRMKLTRAGGGLSFDFERVSPIEAAHWLATSALSRGCPTLSRALRCVPG